VRRFTRKLYQSFGDSFPVYALPVLTLFFVSQPVLAQVSGISYPERFRPYSGWTAIVKGDNNTIGMAGATVALPNSIASMESNPAGLAMNLGGLAAQINSFPNQNPELNHGNDHINEYQWGVGTAIPPWGYSISYYSPSSENEGSNEVSVRQVKASIARLIGDHASIGVSVGFDKGIRKFNGDDYSGAHVSGQIGALYKLGDHWVLGASYTPGLDIGPSNDTSEPSSFGFNQTIKVPSITSVGIGFMPNRFFKAGLSILAVSGTGDTALLYDQNVNYGEAFTLQPRLGASYVLAEWHFLKVELAMGTYYEVSRVQGQGNREHGTFGLDVNPWFINTGIGTDMAKDYKNWSVSVGIDLVRTLRTFEIIPKDPVPPYEGTLPPIFKINPNGLADGFTQGETKIMSPPTANDVKDIVQDIPKRMQEKFGGAPNPEPTPSPHRRKKHHRRRPKPTSTPAAPKVYEGAYPKSEHNDD
jgi:hypothetical protein